MANGGGSSDEDYRGGKGTKRSLSPRPSLAIRSSLPLLAFATCALVSSLLILFWHVRLTVRLSTPRTGAWRVPLPIFDAEQKDDERGHGWEVWEIILSCVIVPAAVWRHRTRLAGMLTTVRVRSHSTLLILVLPAVLLGVIVFAAIVRSNGRCTGWIKSDVGYLEGHDNIGLNMRSVCSGRVWEPHVADAIADYLYGQGRAIDVGAFMGYHTLRLARHAAPFEVWAFEGRDTDLLHRNLRRNNAQNVRVVKETVDESWKLSEDMERTLLDDDRPLALVKIDCEGCELYFLRGARTVLERWHPALIVEIQDDATREGARVGGQRMVLPKEGRDDVLSFLRKELGYTVTALSDTYGEPTWDYLALLLQ